METGAPVPRGSQPSTGGSCGGVTSENDPAKFVVCVETNVQAFWRRQLASARATGTGRRSWCCSLRRRPAAAGPPAPRPGRSIAPRTSGSIWTWDSSTSCSGAFTRAAATSPRPTSSRTSTATACRTARDRARVRRAEEAHPAERGPLSVRARAAGRLLRRRLGTRRLRRRQGQPRRDRRGARRRGGHRRRPDSEAGHRPREPGDLHPRQLRRPAEVVHRRHGDRRSRRLRHLPRRRLT